MHTYMPIRKNLRATFVLGVFLLSTLLPASMTLLQFTATSILPQNNAVPTNITPELAEMISTGGDSSIPIIVSTYADVVAVVEELKRLGGTVGILYESIPAFSASIPANNILKLATSKMVKFLSFDRMLELQDIGQEYSIPGGDEGFELPLYRPYELGEDVETLPQVHMS